jgi:hypothetical protein
MAGNLPLITALVATVWLPANFLVSEVLSRSLDPDNPVTLMQLTGVVETFFGPIIAASVHWSLAERMEGRRPGYLGAMRAALHHWGRLFGARLVAQLIVLLGLLALIVPGLVLAVRFALIDPVVVLEGAGVTAARVRSEKLVRGQSWQVFLALLLAQAVALVAAMLLSEVADVIAPTKALGGDLIVRTLLDVLATLPACVAFAVYWETRWRKDNVEMADVAGEAG